MNNENNSYLTGKHKQHPQLSLDNPELPSKTDWWDDLCQKEGVKNYWKTAAQKKKKK